MNRRMEVRVFCDELFTPFQRHIGCTLRIAGGKILQILESSQARSVPTGPVLHVPGAIVAPGFVDLHIHGAGGRDVMEGTLESLQTICATLARHGTTSFLATTVSAEAAVLEAAVAGYAASLPGLGDGAEPLGIHLEGPYISPLRKGTHNEAYLKKADVDAFRRLQELSGWAIRKITIAPEMDPGFTLTHEACSSGVVVSMGHSDATETQALEALDAGITQATHTFNTMRPFHQRNPGILGVTLTDDRVFAEVIADGIHVHPAALRLLLRAKGVERTLLVTDGISAVGMPDGRYPLGDREVVVEEGECRDPEGNLAGSTLTLDRAVRNVVAWCDLPLHEALAAASATPGRSMGIGDRKGIISPGADADLVFLSHGLEVLATMVRGRLVYCPDSAFLRPPGSPG